MSGPTSAAQGAAQPLDSPSVDTASLSSEEGALRAQHVERQRVRAAGLKGCAAGALAGAVLARLLTKDTQKTVLAGVAGCAMGAAAGAARGRYVHAKAQSYADDQSAERELIAGLEGDIADFRQMNGASEQLLASQQAKVKQLNKQYAKQAITADQYRGQIAGAEGNLKALRASVDDMSANIETLNEDIARLRSGGRSVDEFEVRRQQLIAERTRAEAHLRQLQALYASVPSAVRPAPVG